MNKAKVSIVRCSDYDCARILLALRKGIELIGGLEGLLGPQQRVLVKINHLPPASPAERGIVTHPVFVEAVLHLLKETGAQITVGDDIESSARDGYEISGFRQMSERMGVNLVNLREAGFVEVEGNGYLVKRVYVSRVARDADVIVNLPKLKTHALTTFTGGVKNMYGVIPVGLRTRFHGEYLRRDDFCQMLTDIFALVKPQLTIMDGIIAMEGEGPASGGLKELGIILAGWDAVAIDAVATKVIGLEPMSIATTRFAAERGLGVGDLHNIEVLGEKIEDVRDAGFRLPLGVAGALAVKVPGFFSRFWLDRLLTRPRVLGSKCTACLECSNICPVSAISASDGSVMINQAECIKCMCCLEVCRYEAIVPRQPVLGRVLDLMIKKGQRVMAAVR